MSNTMGAVPQKLKRRKLRRKKHQSLLSLVPLLGLMTGFLLTVSTLGLQNPVTGEVIVPPGEIPAKVAQAVTGQPKAELELTRVKVKVEEYEVQPGETVQDIRRNINLASGRPKDLTTGIGFDGYVRWNVHWDYGIGTGVDGACHITNPKVKGRARLTMPKLVNQESVPVGVLARWKGYIKALRLHEDGHVAHAQEAVDRIMELLRSPVAAPDCSKLANDTETAAQAIAQQQAQKDRDYDRDTRHGATQGAVFP